MTEFQVSSQGRIEALDITDLVPSQQCPDGFIWLSCPHTTAALLLCESDPEMLRDLERCAAQLLAPIQPFEHNKNNNPNAAAHLFSSLIGTQLLLPVREGKLQLGTYQRIVFMELDGPRQRHVQLEQFSALPVAPGRGEAS